RFPSAAYADGCYEQAGIGESPPSSDARHFFVFIELHPRFFLSITAARLSSVLSEAPKSRVNLTSRDRISHS
ncbi:MAG: hypothetical protein WA571_10280, partial [Candidatus Binatus sp.]